MAAPTVKSVVATLNNTAVSVPDGFTATAAVGDLCVILIEGAPAYLLSTAPTYTSGGADAGFSTAFAQHQSASNATQASCYYKVLVSGDITSGAIPANKFTVCAANGSRVGRTQLFVFSHANGWDAATTLVTTQFASNVGTAPQTVATMTDVARPAVGVLGFGIVGGTAAGIQFTWAGAPTGNTAARDPYCDESSSQFFQGGHGAARTDTTGVTVTSGSATVADTHAVAADLGSRVTDATFPANTYITAVNPGVGFTVSANATGNGSTLTLASPHSGGNTSVLQADYQEFDVADTLGTVTASSSTSSNAGLFALAEFQAKAITAAVGTATETDSAVTVGHTKTETLGVAVESDTAFHIARASNNQTLGVATETDTAVSIRPARLKPVGTATETDTAPTIRAGHQVAVGIALESDVAFSLEPQSTKTISFLLSDPGDHGSATRKLVVYANKTDALESGTISFQLYDGATLLNTFAATPLTTTDTAYILPITGTVTDFTILEAVITIGSAGSLTAQVNDVELIFDNELATATETDTAIAIRPNRLKPIGTASETDTAVNIHSSHAHVLGVAIETDTALAVVAPAVLGVRANIRTDSRGHVKTVSNVAVKE